MRGHPPARVISGGSVVEQGSGRRLAGLAVVAFALAARAAALDVVNTASVSFVNEAGVAQSPAAGSAAFTLDATAPVLVLAKEASTTDFYHGQDTVFTLTVVNAGDGTAFNVVLLDTLPGLLGFVSGTATPGADSGWDPATGPPERLRWSVGTLAPGASSSVRFTARGADPGGGDQLVLNSAIAHYTTSTGLARPPAEDFVVVRVRAGEPPVNDIRLIVEIFDSTGRLVAVLNDEMVAAVVALRSLAEGRSDVRVRTGGFVPVELTSGKVLKWDTRDLDGVPVSSGFYTVRVTSVLSDGRANVCSATFALSRLQDDVIVSANVVPNPSREVAWLVCSLASPGVVVEVKVYNVAGELVRSEAMGPGMRSCRWDLRNSAGLRVANGLYVVVLDAWDPATGAREKTMLKLAVEGGP